MPAPGTNSLNIDQIGYEKLLNDDTASLEEQERQPTQSIKLHQGRCFKYSVVGVLGLFISILLVTSFSWVF